MVEAEIQKKDKKDEKKLVVSVDAASSANAAGMAFKGEATLRVTPIPVSISAGGGLLNLNYMNGPLGFGTGRIGFGTNVGPNWNAFGQVALAAFPKTDISTAQYFEGLNAGLTWTIVPEKGGAMFRVGIADTTRINEVPGGTVVDQLYESVGGGASFGYRRLTIFAMGKAVISPYNPTQQYWSEILRPFPEQLKIGTMVDINKGNEIGAELNVSNFERGGRLIFNFASLRIPTQVSLTYRNTSKAFGGANEFGTSIAVKLDGKYANAKLRADFEAGGASLAKPTDYTVRSIYAGAVGQYLYGRNLLNPTELVQRLYPGATISGTNTSEIGGRQIVTVNYTLNGSKHSINIPSRDSALQSARSELGQQTFNVLEDLYSSSSLTEFAGKYAHRTLDDKVYAAAALAQIARSGYSVVLEDASPFASLKKNISILNPETEFMTARNSLFENKKLNTGICVNIDGLAAAFLRQTGVEAYTLVVGSGTGLHAIAGAIDASGKTGYAISYGQIYRSENGGLWPAVQAYSKENGIVLIGSLVFGEGNRLVGYYKGPEGRLMDTVLDSGDDPFLNALTKRNR